MKTTTEKGDPHVHHPAVKHRLDVAGIGLCAVLIVKRHKQRAWQQGVLDADLPLGSALLDGGHAAILQPRCCCCNSATRYKSAVSGSGCYRFG